MRAYIGMGANLPTRVGPPESTLVAAAARLESLGRVVCRSSLYSTKPVGYADQPRFLNAVVAIETELAPRALLEGLLRIEREFGRDRSAGIQDGPRTLDLDLLLMGDLAIHEPGLEIPHPRLGERAFVLVPLNEMAPDLLVAATRKSVKQLLEELRSGSPTESDAAFPIQTGVWRPGPCGHDRMRANEADPHRHG